MVDDKLLIIGLPSSGLHRLTDTLDVRHIEDADIRHAYDNPDEPRNITPEWMIDRWARFIDKNKSHRGFLIYRTPWRLLERQLRYSGVVPNARDQLESRARNALSFWHTYHLALFGLRRHHEGQFLLINGDRPIVIDAAVVLLERNFNLRPGLRQDSRASEGDETASNHEEVYCQIVDALAPECLELYTALESCAELMGRQPEFEFGGLARRNAFLSDMLHVAARQSRIEHLLDRHGIEAGDVDLRVENVLRTRKEFNDSEGERGRTLSALEDKLAAGNLQVESVRQETELYLIQLQQIQEELEHYFELNQQKEKQLADLQQQLESKFAPLARKFARNAVGLKNSAARFIASPGRFAAGWFWWARKSERTLRRQIQTLRESGLFGEKWYLQIYPDVAQAGHDPIEHYLRFGAFEARNPSPHFDTSLYLEIHPDVADAGMNPLLHYIKFGKSEGRRSMRVLA